MKLYAPVRADGGFDFYDIRRSRKSVAVSDRDAVHGVRVARIEATILDAAPAGSTWEKDRVSFIVQNPDGTFWSDTLSVSAAETESWWGDDPTKPERMAAAGFKTVAMRFVVAAHSSGAPRRVSGDQE